MLSTIETPNDESVLVESPIVIGSVIDVPNVMPLVRIGAPVMDSTMGAPNDSILVMSGVLVTVSGIEMPNDSRRRAVGALVTLRIRERANDKDEKETIEDKEKDTLLDSPSPMFRKTVGVLVMPRMIASTQLPFAPTKFPNIIDSDSVRGTLTARSKLADCAAVTV
jgi:hypothetical protein